MTDQAATFCRFEVPYHASSVPLRCLLPPGHDNWHQNRNLRFNDEGVVVFEPPRWNLIGWGERRDIACDVCGRADTYIYRSRKIRGVYRCQNCTPSIDQARDG